MVGRRNDTMRLRMRTGMNGGMDEILMASLDLDVCIYITCCMLMRTRIGKRGRTNKYDSIKGLTADFICDNIMLKLYFRICTSCISEYDNTSQYALSPLEHRQSSTHPLCIFFHFITRSINHIIIV